MRDNAKTASMLYLKITNQAPAGGAMPPGTSGLGPQDAGTIAEWILEGAPPP